MWKCVCRLRVVSEDSRFGKANFGRNFSRRRASEATIGLFALLSRPIYHLLTNVGCLFYYCFFSQPHGNLFCMHYRDRDDEYPKDDANSIASPDGGQPRLLIQGQADRPIVVLKLNKA